MFRKLVANISFSPSLIGELGFYAKCLKQEESVRGLGLIIAALALAVQCITVLQPPESANTAHTNDLLYGGITSKEDLLTKYNNNEHNTQDIYHSLGIDSHELQLAQPGAISSRSASYVAGRDSQLSPGEGARSYAFQKSSGGSGTLYFQPLNKLDARAVESPYKSYPALIGQSTKAGKFAIILASGNLVLQQLPSSAISPSCTSAPGTCPTINYTKSATNSTKNRLATLAPATASDRITYTIRAKNTGTQLAESVPLSDKLGDVLEYADIVDTGGGTFDQDTATLSWPDATIEAGQSISRSFSVRLKPHIPATAQGSSNPMSYDCVMTNAQSNTVAIEVHCPAPKLVELLATDLPQTSPRSSLMAGGGVFLVIAYLYLRARQQREELRLIRKDINTGTI